jgi:hypothetical protein
MRSCNAFLSLFALLQELAAATQRLAAQFNNPVEIGDTIP